MPQALVGLSEWLGGAQECAARLAEGWREGQYLQYMPGPFWIIVVLTLLVLLLPILLQIWGWTFWVALSAILGISRTVFCVFTVLHILVDVWMISVLKTCYTAYRVVWGVLRPKAADSTRHRLFTAKDRKEFEALAEQVDKEDGASDWRADNETDLPQAATLKSTIAKLDECLQTKDTSKLIFILLNGLLKRNHLGIDERVSVETTTTFLPSLPALPWLRRDNYFLPKHAFTLIFTPPTHPRPAGFAQSGLERHQAPSGAVRRQGGGVHQVSRRLRGALKGGENAVCQESPEGPRADGALALRGWKHQHVPRR